MHGYCRALRGALSCVALRCGAALHVNESCAVAVSRDVDRDDPYAARAVVPVDCGLRCRMSAGVVVVYEDDEALQRDDPLDMFYPQLSEFLVDQAVLTRLISDGPL